ncbi:MAG TPA: hypothetical protein VGX25_01435 [Actinophytocola sp.]|uniref:hypothetical protein n=1 Tax=Actinophytocola sp. TaxID=1872138 RepID=UPI002DDD84A4|nr:hypothetical protein [Actinophytocola sp.]HEV2778039.1 hypothetical protein [Actinophytocola sp.]
MSHDVYVPKSTLCPRMGFVLDVVGYGRRTWQAQAWVETRLNSLVVSILADIGIERDEAWIDGRSGDSVLVFFPAGVDPTTMLPGLLMAAANRLVRENAPSGDPMRIRMAVGFGLVGYGERGTTGPLVVDLSRLNDCEPIRQAVEDHPNSDLVAVVADTLYQYLVRSGPLPSYLGTFRRVDVVRKEFSEPAWLWLPSDLTDLRPAGKSWGF